MEIKTMKQKLAMNETEHDLKMQQMKLELEREMLKMQVTHRIEVEELKSQKKDQQTRPSEKMESVVDALSRNGSHVSVAFHGETMGGGVRPWLREGKQQGVTLPVAYREDMENLKIKGKKPGDTIEGDALFAAALPFALGGGSTPVAPSEHHSEGDRHASVLPVTAQGTWDGLLTPLLTGVLPERPMLTKKDQRGWQEFECKWLKRYNTWGALCRSTPHDALLLDDLRKCLDSTDQTLLQGMEEEHPGLTYRQFFHELKSMYDRDAGLQNRQAWERLVREPTHELSMETWAAFTAKFKLLRNRVEDKGEAEERTLLMRYFPSDWRKEILKEEAKRNKGKWIVKMTGIPFGKPLITVQQDLEQALGIELFAIKATVSGVLIYCPDQITLEKC